MKIFYLLLLVALHTIASAQYTVLTDFTNNGAFTSGGQSVNQSLISDGVFLYGVGRGGTNYKGKFFKMLLDGTGYTTLINFVGVTNGSDPCGTPFFDGTFLYGMTTTGGSNNLGTIYKIMPNGTGYAKLFDFSGTVDGSYPYGSLISDGTFLYGVTNDGGTNGSGTVFKIMPDGTGYIKLLDCDGLTTGRRPEGTLFSDGSFLYGATRFGGINNLGIIFKVSLTGTGYTKLKDFAGAAGGKHPTGTLISDGTFLYGITYSGGTNDLGTMFKIKPDATSFSIIMNFAGSINGSYPYGSLISDGTFLYGMTYAGGTNDLGTVFKILSNGSGYTKLLDFAGAANGSNPMGSLMLNGASLYGITSSGGVNGAGTIFKINPNGTGYTNLMNYIGGVNGTVPYGSIVSDGTFLYGMTNQGGSNSMGTIFKIKSDGTGFTKLMDFAGAANGSGPDGCSLIWDGTFLYGMTTWGGINNTGTIFKILPDGSGYTKLKDFPKTTGIPKGSLVSDGTFLYGMTTQNMTPTTGNSYGSIFRISKDGAGYTPLIIFDPSATGYSPWLNSLSWDGFYLYGMTTGGGSNSVGTLFKILPNGTGYTQIIDFEGVTNGSNPCGTPFFDGTFFYGMTKEGGVNNLGTIFKIKPDGTGYVKLMDFAGVANGSNPHGSLVSDGTYFYGMTYTGGANNGGTLFKIMPDGMGYTKLRDFSRTLSGEGPEGTLILDNTYLYGMTPFGGSFGIGTVFKYKYCVDITANASNTSLCLGSSVSLTGTGATSYTWTGGVVNGTGFTPTTTVNYSVTGSGGGGCSNTATILVTIDNTCQDVWPGDANSDGLADNLDILELGLHYTQTGTPRATISNLWQSYYAANWSGNITNGKNLNHSNCNGDGIINDDDTLAIFNNYNLTHAFKTNQTTTNPQITIVPDQSTVSKGSWGTASIYLGDATTPIINVNGVAFTVNYDNNLIDLNSVWIEYPTSFINASNQNLKFRKRAFANGKLYTATTHTVNGDVSGYGKIAILHYKINPSLVTDNVLNLSVSQVNQSNANGSITPLTAGSASLTALGSSITTNLNELINGNYISIHPNPTNGALIINSITELQKIEVVAITGQLLISEVPSSANHLLQLHHLVNGIYFVNLYQNNRIVKREKIILYR